MYYIESSCFLIEEINILLKYGLSWKKSCAMLILSFVQSE
jgi:hypothetical protein